MPHDDATLNTNLINSESLWRSAAFSCLLVAAACWWRDYADAAFVAAALGVVAWFVSLRQRLRASVAGADAGTVDKTNENSGEDDED